MLFKKKKPIIGRVEKINITELNLQEVDAKIDTGAYRGTLHGEDMHVVNEEGKEVLIFKTFNSTGDELVEHRVEEFRQKRIRSSQTDYEDRYIIPLTLEIGDKKINTELSLSARHDSRFNILVGRKPLKRRFLIDVCGKYKLSK